MTGDLLRRARELDTQCRDLWQAANPRSARIGGSASARIGFWGATPVVQSAGAAQAAVMLGNVDGEIGGLTISDPPTQAEVQALRDKCEKLADDVRTLSALVHALRGGARRGRGGKGWGVGLGCATTQPLRRHGSGRPSLRQPAPDRSARCPAH